MKLQAFIVAINAFATGWAGSTSVACVEDRQWLAVAVMIVFAVIHLLLGIDAWREIPADKKERTL